ncbi:MAG TPA: maleylpyruvate isomerase N-terminal domain-containing protein [Anaerolineales bacterium]|nr:maleylpyruvate isomerase N-terminal domain-containing protein [Anaerolineales bacterium]HLO31784.1 maleylpyruvate isomerase N-terminal domain-containing protein [Anaerolineales bacterium]
MTFPYAQENAESRRRLESIVRSLSSADLTLSTHYGWTIPALLAHLAFWDQRVLVILRRWKETGFDPSPIDSVAVNDALKVLCHELDPKTALELCLSSAEAVDAELATLTPELVKQIEEHAEATETQFRMNRALHRNGHLDDIEALLQK